MAIKLDDKWYDETQFTPEIKQAIIQVSRYHKQVTSLMQDVQNAKIIIAHHAKYIQDNVPASAEVEEPKAKVEPKAEDDYGNPTTE